MKKKIIAIAIISMFLLTGLTTVSAVKIKASEKIPTTGTTWYVPGDFGTIQEAIDSNLVKNGDTIFVYSGTYHETIVIDKSIILQGENRETTIIDADASHEEVIRIEGKTNRVTISGFTIKNSKDEAIRTGISTEIYRGIKITDNIITNTSRGIALYTSVLCTVTGNIITDNYYGIMLSSNLCTIGGDGELKNDINNNTVGISGGFIYNRNALKKNNLFSDNEVDIKGIFGNNAKETTHPFFMGFLEKLPNAFPLLKLLLIGIIAPQSGAVQELAEQQNIVQSPVEEEIYQIPWGIIDLQDNMIELDFEAQNSITLMDVYEIYYNVKITGTIHHHSYIAPKFLMGYRYIELNEGDRIDMQCPIFYRILDFRSELPPEEQAIDGVGFSVAIKVFRAPED